MRAGPKRDVTSTKLPRLRSRTPAGRFEEFCRKHLQHVKGEWAAQPFKLAPWQREDIARPLFNTLNEDGLRRYRTCYIEVPRKNAKSTFAAALGLFMLYADGEPGAEVISAAADRQQAHVTFDIARSMVEASPVLSAMTQVYRRELIIPGRGSSPECSYRVISSEAYSKHGMNLSCAVIDELHAHESEELLEVLMTSMGSRRQPITFIITTAGYRKDTICGRMHEQAERIKADPASNPTFLPVIYGAAREDDWRSPDTWRAANPGYGVTVKRDYLAQECLRAQTMPTYESAFRRWHLNVWTESARRWLSGDDWAQCAGPVAWPEMARALEGRACWVGVDLASSQDLTAVVGVFPDEAGGVDILCKFWVPEQTLLERVRKDKAPYDVWRDRGALETVPGQRMDYARVRALLQQWRERYQIAEVDFDDWGAAALVPQLEEDGFPNVVTVPQGLKHMYAPSKELETLVVEHRLRHGGHPIMAWCAGNATVEVNAEGHYWPAKKLSTERIDGIIACVCALHGHMLRPNPGWTVYADRFRLGQPLLSVI